MITLNAAIAEPFATASPTNSDVEISGTAILTIAVSTEERSEADLSWFVDDIVSRDLRTVHGVASVRREGGVNRELRIELDPDHMQALGLKTVAGPCNQPSGDTVDRDLDAVIE